MPGQQDTAMIVITGSATIRAEGLDAALKLGIEHSARSRAEPGCLAHNCHIDAEDPNRIVFVEEWADMEAVTAHFALPESVAFVRALSILAHGPPTMSIYSVQRIPRG